MIGTSVTSSYLFLIGTSPTSLLGPIGMAQFFTVLFEQLASGRTMHINNEKESRVIESRGGGTLWKDRRYSHARLKGQRILKGWAAPSSGRGSDSVG